MNAAKTEKKSPQSWFTIERVIFTLAVIFVAVVHQAATHDRLLLILYSLVTAGVSYVLMRRRAIGLTAILGMAVGATIFAATYYAAKPDNWHPVVDPIRDMAGLGILLLIVAKIIHELYRLELDERRRQARQVMERKIIEMAAAALRSTSHEVRTPLSTITALSEALLDESAGDLNEVQREFISDIDGAANHLMELVNDILDYARAEAGMITLAPEPVALVELVEQCVAMIGPKSEAAGVTVSAHVAPELNEIVADPLRLKQILLNLLSNGVKYNGSGGSVNVRVRLDADWVVISVRDTGRGIAPEHREHLFDPYYQAAVADQSIGTGLGLAIIKHLADLHGGSVSVESVVDTGTVFMVRLPHVSPDGPEARKMLGDKRGAQRQSEQDVSLNAAAEPEQGALSSNATVE